MLRLGITVEVGPASLLDRMLRARCQSGIVACAGALAVSLLAMLSTRHVSARVEGSTRALMVGLAGGLIVVCAPAGFGKSALLARLGGGADRHDVMLRDATLRWADIRGVDLFEVDLRNADLRGADLSEATSLSEAYLCGADLSGANLSGTDLERATVLLPDTERGQLCILFAAEPLTAQSLSTLSRR